MYNECMYLNNHLEAIIIQSYYSKSTVNYTCSLNTREMGISIVESTLSQFPIKYKTNFMLSFKYQIIIGVSV